MKHKPFVKILWLAFFFALIIYHALSYYVLYGAVKGIDQFVSILSYVFLFLGIFSVVALINVDIFMLSKPGTISISVESLPIGVADKSEEEILKIAKAHWFQIRYILTLSLAELSGILGLVLSILGGNQVYISTLFGFAYFSLVYLRFRLGMTWEKLYLS